MAAMPLDPARIRFVTSRYVDLRGLRRCGAGVAMVAAAGSARVVGVDGVGILVPIVLMVGFGSTVMKWCDGYYARRFGRVRNGDDADELRRGFRKGAGFGVFAALTMILDSHYAGRGVPSLFLAFLGAFPAWHFLRDWPYRPYLLVDVCAALVASVLFAAAQPEGRASEWIVEHYFATGFAVLGISAIVTGLFDHWLLARSIIPGRAGCMEQAKHVDPV